MQVNNIRNYVLEYLLILGKWDSYIIIGLALVAGGYILYNGLPNILRLVFVNPDGQTLNPLAIDLARRAWIAQGKDPALFEQELAKRM